jgi:drug/metabolite transporter (DMT)-like permease
MTPPPRATVNARTGIAALILTVVLWSSFALSSRGIGTSSLTLIDVALLRFWIPVAVLTPWAPRLVRQLRAERPVVLLTLLVAGLPHFLLFALGAGLTSATLTGLIVPGTVPLFVTLLGFALWKNRIKARQAAALAAITAGVATTALFTAPSALQPGIAVLLVAGFAWAVYTLGLGRTKLTALSVVYFICTVSALAATVLALTGTMPSHLLNGAALVPDVLLFGAIQGVGTGLLSTLSYAVAVRHLGSPAAAAAGALSPVLTAVLAALLFAEPATPALFAGMALIIGGVLVFNTGRFPVRMRARPKAARVPAIRLKRWTHRPPPPDTLPAASKPSPDSSAATSIKTTNTPPSWLPTTTA